MLEFFQILVNNISVTTETCGGLLPVVRIIRAVIDVAHIVIPVILIAFGTLDLGKAVMASDEKKIKESQGLLIKRCIYAVVVFLIPYLIGLVMGLVDAASSNDTGNTSGWATCWDEAGK